MRFISKNSNLRIIISPGLPAEPLAGRLAVPGVSVKFQNGVADVGDEELINKMTAHSGFNVDFIAADPSNGDFRDPYASFREETEPAHVISEIKYGHVEKSVGTPRKFKVPAEIETMINAKAVEIAKAMLPSMIKETLAGLMGSAKAGEEKESETKPQETQSASESGSSPVQEPQGQAAPEVKKQRGRPPAKQASEEEVV